MAAGLWDCSNFCKLINTSTSEQLTWACQSPRRKGHRLTGKDALHQTLSFSWYLQIQLDLNRALCIHLCHCYSCRIRHCAINYIQNYLRWFNLEKKLRKYCLRNKVALFSTLGFIGIFKKFCFAWWLIYWLDFTSSMRLLIFILFSCINLLHFHKTRLEEEAMPKVQLLLGQGSEQLPWAHSSAAGKGCHSTGSHPRWTSTLVLSSCAHLLPSQSLPCCLQQLLPGLGELLDTCGSGAAPRAQSSRKWDTG